MKNPQSRLTLENLERRETPAVFVNATTLTYRDLDGDNVIVKFSKPILTAGNAPTIFTFNNAFGTLTGQQLQTIDLTSVAATAGGTTITTTALRSPVNGGDGFAALGQINATGIDLGAVNIDGDLGRIVSGNAITTTPGLASLTVASLGRFGTNTGATDLNTVVQGKLGALTVKGDVKEAFIDVQGGGDGDIGPVTIAGSVIGGISANSGRFRAGGDIGIVSIKGNVTAGDGDDSGRIEALGKLGNVTIGGNLQGAFGLSSGGISSVGGMGAIKIAGDLLGGSRNFSGRIFSMSTLASVTIGGNVIGGTANPSGFIESDGAMGPVKIAGDLIGGANFSGRIISGGTLASVTIGGDLRGSAGSNTARIFASGAMGPVKIAGDVIGGSASSGAVLTNGTLASVTIGGNLIGGVGLESGRIYSSGAMGPVKIAGDVIGGTGSHSGEVFTDETLAGVTIGGDVLGGAGNNSGQVFADFSMSTVSIAGDVIGGGGQFSGQIFSGGLLGSIKITGNLVGGSASAGNLEESGIVQAQRLGTLTIGGSLIAGTDTTPGTYKNNGAIRAFDDIGTATIGNIIGNATNPAIISARGKANPTTTSDVAIGSLKVLGRVEYGQILAGFDFVGGASNADAQIGAVTVGGDWIASSVVAGAIPGNGLYGDTGDAKMSGVGVKDVATLSSKITSLTIGGQAYGTFGGTDHFGIVAENIGIVRVGGTLIPTTAGNGNDDFALGITGDFKINEI